MTTYNMYVKKMCSDVGFAEIEADSLEEARKIFDEDHHKYVDEAMLNADYIEDDVVFFLYGAEWRDENASKDSWVSLAKPEIRLHNLADKKSCEFDFLPEWAPINALLSACVSPSDVEYQDLLGLTETEKREVMSRFIRSHQYTDADWREIDSHVYNVVSERSPTSIKKRGKKTKSIEFNFLPQAASIKALLKASIAALPHLPAREKRCLVAAMREFEGCGTSVLWSPSDVDTEDAYGLTEAEKREAISRFIRGQECTDEDWAAIDSHACDVVSDRSPKGGKKTKTA